MAARRQSAVDVAPAHLELNDLRILPARRAAGCPAAGGAVLTAVQPEAAHWAADEGVHIRDDHRQRERLEELGAEAAEEVAVAAALVATEAAGEVGSRKQRPLAAALQRTPILRGEARAEVG